MYCYVRQDVACAGGAGWAVALCWMAGCAALCAAPLLLHAELAVTATRAPSVGLLCGTCRCTRAGAQEGWACH